MDDMEDRVTALRGMGLLAGIDAETLGALAEEMREERLEAGSWAFHQGDPPDALVLVASGRMEVVDEAAGHVLRDVTVGEWTGELGVVSGEPRSAGLRAARDSQLWLISAEAFQQVLDAHPSLQQALLQTLARMLRQSRPMASHHRLATIGVVSRRASRSAERTARALADALAAYGSVDMLEPPADGSELSREEATRRLGSTLDSAEAAADWVLLWADGRSGDGWLSFVLDQSDRVVVVVDEERPVRWDGHLPTLGGRRCDLAIVNAGPSLEWWTTFEPASHHLVGSDPNRLALAPLARRVAGRSLGLVMGGGGARGVAHFGVYETLVEAGVPLDRFGGTSAGAISAGAFAMGMPAEEAMVLARRLLTRSGIVSDYTIPAVSLVRGDRIERAGNQFYGDRLIEQLPKGFFSVSADLVTGQEVVHRRGSLWRAVRASISIPGLMPPVRDGDRVLVDGGLMNNLPADVMAEDPDGQVICVDLRRVYTPSRGFGLLPVQPPAIVRRLVAGTDEELPAIQDTLMRSIDLAASARPFEGVPNIAAVVRPDVSAIGLLNFKQFDDAVEAGRVAARRALDAGLSALAES
jgi:NTE family protein